VAKHAAATLILAASVELRLIGLPLKQVQISDRVGSSKCELVY
jgi:hypothetical protein